MATPPVTVSLDRDSPGIPAGFVEWFGCQSWSLPDLTSVAESILHWQGQATLLNTRCRVELLISDDDRFLALCARPLQVQDAWGLLNSFPSLIDDGFSDLQSAAAVDTDEAGDAASEVGVYLQDLGLDNALLLLTADGPASALATLLQPMALWQSWLHEQADPEATTAALAHHNGFSLLGHLGLKAEPNGPLAALRELLGAVCHFDAGVAQASIQLQPLPYLQLRQPIGGQAQLGPLLLNDAAVALAAPLYPADEPARVVVSGSATLGGHRLDLQAEVPMGEGDLVITGQLVAASAAPLPGIAMQGLPALNAGEKIEVELRLDPSVPHLEKLLLFIERDHWALLGDTLSLDHAAFAIWIDDPLGDKFLGASAVAQVRLQGHAFQLSGLYPGGPIRGEFVPERDASGTVQPLQLQALATSLGMDGSMLPAADIEAVHASYGLGGDGWEFGLSVSDAWSPPGCHGLLQLEGLRFALQGPAPTAVHLDARLLLGNSVHLAVSATHHGGAGWALYGATGPNEPLRVGELLDALAQRFGATTALPQALRSLTFSDLAVSYSQIEATLSFAGQMLLRIEGTALRLSLSVVVRNTGSGHSVQAQGSFTLAGEQFSFSGRSEHEAGHAQTALVASYEHLPGGTRPPPDVHALVAALSPALAAVVPPVKVVGASLAYLSEGDAGHETARWLFGARFEAELTVHANVDGVPIVSTLLGDHLDLSVRDLQVVVASKPFTAQDISALGSVTAIHLPASLQRAMISATLGFGGDSHALVLPIGSAADAPTAALTTAPTSTPATTPPTATAVAARAAAPATTAAADSSAKPPAVAAADTSGTQWLPTAKQVGPLYVEQIGVAFRDGQLSIAVGLLVALSSVTLSLQGLRVSSPLNAFKPSFDLAGIGLACSAGALDISGGLLKSGSGAATQYSGQALIKSAGFTLSALGAYAATPQGDASLFIFGLLEKDFGGPAMFHVTGLAAGFGVNRKLKLPGLDEVATFPLVSMVTAEDAASKPRNPAQALALLDSAIEVAAGENWLAIGVRFTSYEVVKSFALLAVSFGTEVEIDLIGESTLTMPTELPPGQTAVAFARLAERATFIPRLGELKAAFKLSPDAYILSKDCHLTGGFALSSWFKGEHEGDFVVCLGGYHPHYTKPAHYPDVVPVGFTWQIGDLVVKGGMYFALTPSAVMAGGYLDAVWHSGGLSAWFLVHADFLMSWKPFHYEASVSVSIGASFRVDLWITSFTMTIHVDVALQLWGPDFGGTAVVDLDVISFTVNFGAGRPAKAAIGWAEFQRSFLPPLKLLSTPEVPALAVLPASYTGPAAAFSSGRCMARAGAGLERELAPWWVVNGSGFELVTHSVIPANAAFMYFSGGKNAEKPRVSLLDLAGLSAVAPVELGPVDLPAAQWLSEHFVVVNKLDDKTGQAEPGFCFLDHVSVVARQAPVPLAIWSQAGAMGAAADGATAAEVGHNGPATDAQQPLMPGALLGFTFKPRLTIHASSQVDVQALEVEDGDARPPTAFWSHPAPTQATEQRHTSLVAERRQANASAEELNTALCQEMISCMTQTRERRVELVDALSKLLGLDSDERATAVPMDAGLVLNRAPVFATLGGGL